VGLNDLMGGHHLCGLFVLQPGGEQQNLAVHRGNVDVKDLIAILQLEEVAPARIRLSWRSVGQQTAKLLNGFRAMMPKVLNIWLLIQPQNHPSSLSFASI